MTLPLRPLPTIAPSSELRTPCYFALNYRLTAYALLRPARRVDNPTMKSGPSYRPGASPWTGSFRRRDIDESGEEDSLSSFLGQLGSTLRHPNGQELPAHTVCLTTLGRSTPCEFTSLPSSPVCVASHDRVCHFTSISYARLHLHSCKDMSFTSCRPRSTRDFPRPTWVTERHRHRTRYRSFGSNLRQGRFAR
jgi:hypothetical protein